MLLHLYKYNYLYLAEKTLCVMKCFVFQGCLAPVKVIIPPGSILQPSQNAAVVGGNVLTSQRVVDVIFKAFQVCAASQVCHISQNDLYLHLSMKSPCVAKI